MIINITSETGETSTDSTVKPAPAKGKEKLPRWFNTIAATKKQINKMKKGGAQKARPHKRNSKAKHHGKLVWVHSSCGRMHR